MSTYQNKFPVIAIDGTASSGKGTLAKKLAVFFGFDHLDSGMLYRIYAHEVLKKKIQEVDKIDINIELFNDKTLYESKNLRSELVSKTASKIAKNEFVRKQLVNLQRHFADKPPNRKGSVIDGRDITSVIVPNAEVKFYIDASLEKRAKRRQIQLNLPEKEYEKVFYEMKTRDYNDKNRENCPLIKTKDSLYIDTSNISEKMVLDIAIKEVKKKIDFI